ncbi:erg10, acetyl-CoA C-acetyltransferase, partial [Clydaea vesicula]
MTTDSNSEVYIVSSVRTAIGSFGKTLAGFTAPELGSFAIKAALEKINLNSNLVEEVFFGNVLSAGVGQNPARQAALLAGLPNSVPCTTINKVCASGMKATIFGAQSILLGNADLVVVGGMESMSNTPYYLPKQRFGTKFGNQEILDGIVKDGLWDFENKCLMGDAADSTAKELSITREEQDSFAIESYKRAQLNTKNSHFKKEICDIVIKSRSGETVFNEDEECWGLNEEKMKTLKPAFSKEGTVTAANASNLNDGASCLILCSSRKLKELKLTPLAKITGWGDAAREPARFTLAPSLAIPKALKKANIQLEDVDFYEINEAFSAVALGNMKLLSIPPEKLNVFGGGVSLGHPLGSSGSRIIVTLLNVLRTNGGKVGCASVCNGGGGASAITV